MCISRSQRFVCRPSQSSSLSGRRPIYAAFLSGTATFFCSPIEFQPRTNTNTYRHWLKWEFCFLTFFFTSSFYKSANLSHFLSSPSRSLWRVKVVVARPWAMIFHFFFAPLFFNFHVQLHSGRKKWPRREAKQHFWFMRRWLLAPTFSPTPPIAQTCLHKFPIVCCPAVDVNLKSAAGSICRRVQLLFGSCSQFREKSQSQLLCQLTCKLKTDFCDPHVCGVTRWRNHFYTQKNLWVPI